MKIFIANKYKICKFILNENDEFYSYGYKYPGMVEEFMFTFEKNNDEWYLKNNGIVNVVSGSNIVIKPYQRVDVKILGIKDSISVFSIPDGDEKAYKLSVENVSEITIGNGNNTICYNLSSIAPVQATIKFDGKSNILYVINDLKYRVYVNNYRVTNAYKLSLGDLIFIDNFTIIWMNKFIIINNPLNLIKVIGLNAYIEKNLIDNSKLEPVSDEDQNYKLYTEEDYFYHTPRIKEVFENELITIELPPAPKEDDDTPWYIKMGSSLTMGISALIAGINLFNNILKKTALISLIPSILMFVSLLIGSFLIPKLLDSWKKKQNAKYEKERVEKYNLYLEEKEKEISMKTKQVIQIMNDNNLSSNNCCLMGVNLSNRNFWCREIISDDFLTVRLGIGRIESPVEINAPEKKFELKTDFLMQRVYDLKEKYKYLDNVPITISLLKNQISAFICSGINRFDYFKNIIVQLILLHSGADLKLVIFTNEDNASKWDYMKFLPHCWSEDQSFRFFATNNEEIKNVSSKLEEEFKKRRDIVGGKEQLKDQNDEVVEIKSSNIYSNFSCYYLIILDSYKNTERISIVDDILSKNDKNFGFGITFLTTSLKNLPVKCDTFIEIGPKEGCILSREISSKKQKTFIVEKSSNLNLREISKGLLNIPLVPKEGISVLPSSLSFLEMYGVSKIEQLNILNRWKTNNPVVSLSTPIGVYANGETFKLDLHEKFHGPHGLIAGTTGSGKSEFIISFVLSMCVNYHPYEVQFVLIDYKGGGLAGAFENRELGTKIPHLSGTITNLDTASMNRTLVSIQSELKRRQQIFNQTRDSLSEGTVDIYKYQRFYREGIVKEPLPHLFIISDEFAELKAQQPDFMDELISTARIGRSLGVHLILATQKPSGVVNDQIWSNSKFKICLKVQDRSDSMEIIKKPDAAYIKESGRFYLQVGNDDFFDKGQSGWSGAKYIPSDRILKKVDDSISFINNTGDIFKSIKDLVVVDNTNDQGEQLTNIVKYIINLGEKEKLKPQKLWLDPIPEIIYVNNLKEKYNYTVEPYVIKPIIGEYDSPSTQTQQLLTYDFNNQGNIMIAGKPGSGKENLISTIILSSVIDHTPSEVNFYIIDCGTEVLRIFSKLPHVGDIAFQDDKDLIMEMLEMISNEIENRKNLMSDYGGNYNDYIKESGNKLPIINVIINNYDVFLEHYSRIEEGLSSLYRDAPRYGINFIVTEIASNALRNRLLQYFNGKFILQQNNTSSYRSDFSAPKGLVPSSNFGRGLVILNEKYYEFQTAYLVQKNGLNKFVREISETYNKAYTVKAKKVPMIPEIVYDTMLYNKLTTLSKLPIGYNIDTKEISYYNFEANQFNQILSYGMDNDKMSFIYAFIKMISKLAGIKVKVVDFVTAIEKDLTGIDIYKDNFDKAIIDINNNIVSNKSNSETTVYIFLGIGTYKTKMSEQGQMILDKLFRSVSNISNAKFIMIDVEASFKNLLTEVWYQDNLNNSCGIWLDYDISTQIVINASNVSLEDRKLEFPQIAFQVFNGKYIIIKHMLEMEEETNEQ